ncbi:MAG: PAS domain S-box protein [Chlorobiaceae bacterium]|nr:PAS domain S-box protein [Chlorobiaceae bacterium]NTV60033.1 PAS domain S-box protein [Chlorobiaceae bacterium]
MQSNSGSKREKQDITYRVIFEESTEPKIIIDRDGMIIDANKAFADTFGKKIPDCIGLNAFSLLPADIAGERKKKIEETFLTGQRLVFEDERNNRFYRNSLYPVKNKEGIFDCIYIFAQDITDIRIAEKRTKKQSAFNREAMEAIPGPFVVLDPGGTIISCNSYFRNVVTGKEEDELSGINTFDLFHPDDRALAIAKLENIKENGTEESAEIRVMIHGGPDFRWFRISTKRIIVDNEMFLVSSGTDIEKYKKTEQELIINNEQLLRILYESRTGGWEWDLKTGVNKWTEGIWELYGLARNSWEPSYESWKRSIIEEDREKTEKAIAEASENGLPFKIQWRVRHADASIHWIFCRGLPCMERDGTVSRYLGIVLDVTDLKSAEMKLRESEERFRKFFEQHSAVMLLLDQQTSDIIDANLAAEEFYGWGQDKLRSMNIRNITPSSSDVITDIFDSWKNTEKRCFTTTHSKADGSIREVEVFAQKVIVKDNVLVYCIIHDITERMIAEKKIGKLSVALEQSPAIVVITDPEGCIEYVNSTFTKHTGYTFEEARGKNPRILQSGLMPHEFYEYLWSSILSGKVWHGEFQNRKKNGDLCWEDAIISAIRDENGGITSFVAVKEDITEKKRIWNELVAARDKAEESDRLKTAFINNISHEIRTPMNGILGFSQLLKEQQLSGEEQREYIELIQQSGERMMRLINDIVEISRIDARDTPVELAEIPLNSLLGYLYEKFSADAEKKGLQLTWKSGLSDEESLIITDGAKLELIMSNLLENAMKFTPEGDIDFGCEKKENLLEFYVVDTGVGIPSGMKEKIFERFNQVDNTLSRMHDGAGLGLSITKSYIEMLGGIIHVEPGISGGSRFYFTLPCTPERHTDPVHPVASESPEKPVMTIVIAEDDEVSALLLKKSLKHENINIMIASNGREAVELVRQHPGTNLVLMDIKMPDMNGFEATRLIKQMRPDLLVIAQTAFASPEDREKAFYAGCDGFLAKPVRKSELLDMIRSLNDK